ncbi:MAG: SCO family protein [Chloroflexi bacterium]|nr:SCO family protein [Chloroflexota bacterium]
MNARTVLIGTGVLLVAVAALLIGMQLYSGGQNFQGSAIEPSPPAFNFELQRTNGNSFRLDEERGKVVLIFFGYANCPDVCPTTLADYKKIHENLGDQAADVDFVFITVDPERDSPEAIAQFVTAFNSDFIGLSGNGEELQPVWDGYFVARQKQESDSEAGYLMAHTPRVYVVDKAGFLRLTFPFGLDADAMTSDVRRLLAEEPSS